MSDNYTAEGAGEFSLPEVRRWPEAEWIKAVEYFKAEQSDRRTLQALFMDGVRHSSAMLESSNDQHLPASWELRVLDISPKLPTPPQLTDGMTNERWVALLKQEGITVIRISTEQELQMELAEVVRSFEQNRETARTANDALQKKLLVYRREIPDTEETILEPTLTIKEDANSKRNCCSKVFDWLRAKPFGWFGANVKYHAQKEAKSNDKPGPVEAKEDAKENCFLKISGWFRAKFCRQTLTKNQIKKLKRKTKRAKTEENCFSKIFRWFKVKFFQQTLSKNQIKKLKAIAKRAKTD